MPSASNLLKDAADLVGMDRAQQHGEKFTNMQNIADVWNALLYAKFRRDGSPDAAFPSHMKLTAVDVASMMELMKIARRYLGEHNIDDYLDAAGYAAVAAEVYDSGGDTQRLANLTDKIVAAAAGPDRTDYLPLPPVAPAVPRRIDDPVSTGSVREYPKPTTLDVRAKLQD